MKKGDSLNDATFDASWSDGWNDDSGTNGRELATSRLHKITFYRLLGVFF